MEWTRSAREELENYFKTITPDLKASDADPSEVREDISRHVEEELLASQCEIVTADDIKKMAQCGMLNSPV